uniref:Pept_C1 domain-containing protein n=1 Tax=Syphacia muris TaxID=451379 RepID=A0A0N5ASN9_9BILA
MNVKLIVLVITAVIVKKLSAEHDLPFDVVWDWIGRTHPMTEYIAFRQEYYREFWSPSELDTRYNNFKRNFFRIRDLNKKYNETSYGITEFADWSDDEMDMLKTKEQYGIEAMGSPAAKFTKRYVASGKEVPTNFSWLDLAKLSRVRNQLHDRGVACNSCWANTILSVIEILYRIQFHEVIFLSDNELIDCDLSNNHCFSGSTKRGFIRGLVDGFVLQENYLGICPKKFDLQIAEIYTFQRYGEKALVDYIANHGPIAVKMRVPSLITDIVWPRQLFSYKGFGIVRADACWGLTKPQHAVVLLGYGEENGVKWGNDGYFRLERGVDACRVESYAMSAKLKKLNVTHNFY